MQGLFQGSQIEMVLSLNPSNVESLNKSGNAGRPYVKRETPYLETPHY